MSKAIVSNKIYLGGLTPEQTKSITQALTYKLAKDMPPPKKGSKLSFIPIETIKNYKILPRGILAIPKGRFDLIPEGYEIEDRRVKVDVPFPDPKAALRSAQVPVWESVNDSCFINAKVGWGKTFTALHIAAKLGQKTLIITHTVALRDQWIQQAEMLFDMPVGRIISGLKDYADHAITVSNIQSLKKVLPELSKEFGLVILDEAHHCPASTFVDTLDTFYARYTIGLSGTMKRKDGKNVVFKDYFGCEEGFVVHQPPQSDTLTPKVYLVRTGISLNASKAWVDRVTELTTDDHYRRLVASIAAAKMSLGHQVLIIADRVEFLKAVNDYIGEKSVLVTGESTLQDRELAKEQIYSKEKMCIAGSRGIFSEGISINPLSCVILAVPIGDNEANLEQIIGRIQRQHEGKLDPEVIDLQFSGYADKKQNNARVGFYLRNGWDMITV